MTEKLQKIARELLPAIGYGDAAGLPVETKSAAEINERYGYIVELLAPHDNPFFKGEWEAGTTSDDTQLSRAVAESLIAAGGFSMDAVAQAHIAAYHETPKVDKGTHMSVRGWGRSTTESMQRLVGGVSPEKSGHPNGAGNGIIMKMAPLAVWQAMADSSASTRKLQYDQLTTMTHDSDVARLCTRVHGEVLTQILTSGNLTKIPEIVHNYLENNIEFPDETALMLRAVDRPCRTLDELSARYAKNLSGKRYGFYVPETLAIVYDVALGSGGDFETAVYRAVNLGGDADSTASIVASMIACSSGGDYNKPHDMEKVQDLDRLYAVSEKLAGLALKERKS